MLFELMVEVPIALGKVCVTLSMGQAVFSPKKWL